MVWPVIGAIAGGLLANQSARQDRKAMQEANDQRMAGFRQYQPYVDATLQGSQTALNDILAAGPYAGQTLAGPNQTQLNTAAMGGAAGQNLMNLGQGLTNFGAMSGGNANQLFNAALNNAANIGNYQNVFDQNIANQGMFADAYGNIANRLGGFGSKIGNLAGRFSNLAGSALSGDSLGAASDYAAANSGSIVDRIMRDSRRALGQDMLNNNIMASGTGNTRSSRAGITEGLLQDRFLDRRADVQSDVENQLRAQALAENANRFNQANTALGNAQGAILSQGNLAGAEAGQLANAANAYNNQAGAAANAVGNLGAVGGALSNAGSFNNQLSNAFNTGLGALNSGFDLGMRAGGFGQAQDQAALADARSRYEMARDFPMQQYQNYMASILGRAPGSSQNVEANMVNPMAASVGGALSGFGMFGGQLPYGVR